MFLTITIDTVKTKKSKIKMKRTRINPKKGWHRSIRVKERTMWQKLSSWRRNMKNARGGVYRLGEQVAMF